MCSLLSDKEYLFLINPKSGKTSLSKKERLIKELVVDENYKVVFTLSEDHAKQLAKEAMLASRIVVACGGDGFHNVIAQQAIETGGLMSVVPLGRGNDFAKSLGIYSLVEAKRAITDGIIRNARYLRVEFENYSRISLTCTGVGLLSEAAERATKIPFFQGKPLYCLAALLSFQNLKSHKYNLTLDGQAMCKELLIFAGAASEYTGGGIFIAPDARKYPLKMNVLFAESVNRPVAIRLLIKALSGKHLAHEKVTSTFCSRCHIENKTDSFWSSLVYGDGEYLGILPSTLSFGERPLNILTPKD